MTGVLIAALMMKCRGVGRVWVGGGGGSREASVLTLSQSEAGPGVGVAVRRGPAPRLRHVLGGPEGGVADTARRVHDLHPGQQREQQEEHHGAELPAGQHLLGLLPELEVHQEYRHSGNSQNIVLYDSQS